VLQAFSVVSASLPKFILNWILPAFIVVGAFALLLGRYSLLPAALVESGVAESIALFVAVVLLAYVMAISSEALYRQLEGYTVPGPLRRWMERRLTAAREELQRLAQSRDGGWVQVLAWERLSLFPPGEVLPTRLGNALAAMEHEAVSRYGLPFNLFWPELIAEANPELRQQYTDARGILDLLVGLSLFAGLFSLTSTTILLMKHSVSEVPLLAGATLLGVLVSRATYNRALDSVIDIRKVTRPIIHSGRLKIAASYGLKLPDTLEAERLMWAALTAFIVHGDREATSKLDQFRVRSS
jgi:hypothetical protein